MSRVPDSQRKNAFSNRLKDKRERSSGNPVGMTPDEMRIAEKHYRDVSVWLFNLSVSIRDPSPKQTQEMNHWLDELKEKIQNIGCKLR
jgi:hypothetical protein